MATRRGQSLDRHAIDVLSSIDRTERWFETLLATGAPGASARGVIEDLSNDLASSLQGFDEFELGELLRVALLPWSFGGESRPGTEKGPALVEVLMLVALSGAGPSPVENAGDPNSRVEEWQEKVVHLLTVALIEVMARAHHSGHPEPLAKIQLATVFREVWMRHSSYPDMWAATLRDLFSSPAIEAAMKKAVGFSALEALNVLDRIHAIQTEAWNRRLEKTFTRLDGLMASGNEPGDVSQDDPRVVEFRDSWASAWNAKRSEVAIAPATISEQSGVALDVVKAVIDAFRFRPSERSIADNVLAFASGDNPWRTNPLLVGDDGCVMLLHDAMNVPAVRENCEQLLRSSEAWEIYQTSRGRVLEDRVRRIFEKLMPGANVLASYEYSFRRRAASRAVSPTSIRSGSREICSSCSMTLRSLSSQRPSQPTRVHARETPASYVETWSA